MRYLRALRTEERPKIDLKDKKILTMLSENSRLPSTAIAKKVGLSRDAVAYRIEGYAKKGITQGYKTIVDIGKFRYDAYHLFLQLRNASEEAEKKLIERLDKNPRVRAILKFSGKYDFELALVARDIHELDELISEIISEAHEFISDYEILAVTKKYVQRAFPRSFLKKEESAIPAKAAKEAKIDSKDELILNSLANEANAPLHKVAANAKLSIDAANYRIKNMLAEGVISKFTVAVNYSSLAYDVYAVMLSIPNLQKATERKLMEVISTDDNIIWAVKALGKYNVLMYVCVDKADKLHKTLIRIRANFPGEIKSYETLLAYEEYKYTYFPENLELI